MPALRNLGRDFEIKAYTFDAETHPRGSERRKARPAGKPAGQETAIGAALDDVLNQENGKRLLGIVILTDGRQQALPPRDASAQDVAAKLRHQSYPVFPVVFGQSRGLGGVQDVAVVDFPPPAAVFVKTEMAIHGEIKISGYVNKPIPVRVLMETPDGKMEVIAQKKVTATIRRRTAAGRLHLHAGDAGRIQAHSGGRSPARRTGDHEQPAKLVRAGAQRRIARALYRRRSPRGTEVPSPLARRLARHQGRFHPPRSASQGDEAPRSDRAVQTGQIRRLYPRRRRFHGLRHGRNWSSSTRRSTTARA